VKHDYNNGRKQRDFLMDGHVGEENLITLSARTRKKHLRASLISVEKCLTYPFYVHNDTNIKQQRT